MLFNSFTFVIFLVVVLGLYNLLQPWPRLNKIHLLVASYIFYAAWNPPFVVLLWISTVVDWAMAQAMYYAKSPAKRRFYLVASLVVNLGLLAFFKYGNFLLANFTALAQATGIPYEPAAMDIILPVGISFYTFMTLSYTLDIYLGRTEPSNSLLDYALYVTFFPHLVAGPIVRAAEFLPQIKFLRPTGEDRLGWGLSLLVLGLFQKVVFADALLAPIADSLYGRSGTPDFLSAWVGTLAFTGQIYCDFAGYSNAAIGVAAILGVAFPINFRFPYGAIGFSDFWQRWHISLSTWLRDYLYIPMGGNRKGPTRTSANLMITMLVGGLWHGASWTFVVWGGLHGLYLLIERRLSQYLGHLTVWKTLPARAILSVLTFALVCITWVFFRATSFRQAFTITASMLGLGSSLPTLRIDTPEALMCLGVIFMLVLTHWVMRNTTIEALAARAPWWAHSLALAAMLIAIVTMRGADRAFIYFQF